MATLEVQLSRVDRTYRPGVSNTCCRGTSNILAPDGCGILLGGMCHARLARNRATATLTPALHITCHFDVLQDSVSGVVTLNATGGPVSHNGLTLRAVGVVRPQMDPRSMGVMEALYSSIKPIELLSSEIEMAPAGKLPGGIQLPFEFPLEALPGKSLTETYHGVYVKVRYTVSATLSRSGGLFGAKPLEAEAEFIVEVPASERKPPAPLQFEIKPETLGNVKAGALGLIPKFLITGSLHRTVCNLTAPFTGDITVVEAATAIKSLELQLVRVESIALGDRVAREATEIQNLQVGDGDVCRQLPIPLHMIFPRTFTCPTVRTDSFKVEFELNIIAVFADNFSVTENFPITLYREPGGAAAAAL